jgi:hypothetical protein
MSTRIGLSPEANLRQVPCVSRVDMRMDIVSCPECDAVATVERYGTAVGSDGPVDHVKISCPNRHWFLLPADLLDRRPDGVVPEGPVQP